jgi:hypothetical protein
MILRGKVSNIDTPVAYSAWNLPPSQAFISFVSNPPADDSGLGLRVRPSLEEEVSALVASLGEIPDDERQVHSEVPLNPSDAEISAMLDMLAEDSSDAVPTETLAVAPIPDDSEALDIQKSDNVRPKRSRRANQPASPADGKKQKKRHLRQVSSFDQDVGPSVPAAEEVTVPAFAETNPDGCSLPAINPNGCDLDDVDPNGCNLDDAEPNVCTVRVVDDGEEEDEIPLTRKNSRRYIASGESSGVPSPALSALVDLQEVSLANFDQALEDMVPVDLLSEPADGGAMDVYADVLDAGLGSSRAASRASSTLERGLEGQEVGLDCTAPMEVTEGPSALEVAAAENSALKDGAGAYPAPEGVAGNDPTPMGSASDNPAPEGVRVGSPSNTSMDVHVGSSPLHSDCIAAVRVSCQEVVLEVNVPNDRVLTSAGDTDLVPNDALRVVPVRGPSVSHRLISHDLGVPSFFSILQVSWFLLP